MTTRQEEQRLYEISGSIADVFDREFTLHAQEALLHEVCHAVALGLRWDKDTPDRVSTRFERINERSNVLGLLHEAQCFAIERHAIRMLGWQRRIPMKKIEAGVWENGHSGGCLPKDVFLLMIRQFMREDKTRQSAVKAASTILRLARSTSAE